MVSRHVQHVVRGMLAALIAMGSLGNAVAAEAPQAYAEFVENKRSEPGFLPLLIDEAAGRIYLQVANDLDEFILVRSYARGVGANDIGIDRGRQAGTALVRFERVGARALLRQRNTRYRASGTAAEQRAVTQSFASAVLWGFDIEAESTDGYVIDVTPYLLSNSQLGPLLKELEQGKFELDERRSAPYLPRIRSFPDNTELEAVVTFTGEDAGSALASVSPATDTFTLHQHFSFVRLPPPGYEPRRFHPFSGFFPFNSYDYSAPIDGDLVQRYVSRHRLKDGDTLTYYLDPGAPEPVRGALLDGARWWSEAFAEAGFPNGFRVELLPEDVDPMDVRYNVIQWVHRSTRGWSYGLSVRDPRTGEIIKGVVSLGSLRIRQDLMIAQGLLSPYSDGTDETAAGEALKAMALARIRQLSAHEVGHTLGLVHNYSASTNGRTSVMDYPHPLLRFKGEQIDLSDAYAVGVGAWDKYAIRYGYQVVPPAEEARFIVQQVAAAQAAGLRFVADADARPRGGAHPRAHLWDSGDDIVTELGSTLAVRELALSRLGADSLRTGTPFSELADVLVPIFYLHRYQSEAVSKLIGGVEYGYTVKGSGTAPNVAPVNGKRQQQALSGLLETLSPSVLTTPETVLRLMPPKALGYLRDRENAPSRTLPLFDPVTAAEAAAEETLSLLLQPDRMARLAQQHARDPSVPSVAAVLDALRAATLNRKAGDGLGEQVAKRINLLVVEHLLVMAWGEDQVPEVSAVAHQQLKTARSRLQRQRDPSSQYLLRLIDRAQEQGKFERRSTVAQLPPGSPI